MTSPPEGVGRALVVGTGLIGGSLGLALRARGWHVTGQDAQPARARAALERGAVDTLGDATGADLVFLATPVAVAGAKARELLDDRGRPDVVVTDVCGVKEPVVRAVGHRRFVGGHPMAGSEQAGLEGADGDLFLGATWVLTPTTETDVAAFGRVREVVRSLGAEVVALSPQDHDRLVAVVSHVPHLVAATLMNAASKDSEADRALLRLAAGGFRDMTRVAAGEPDIWPDICADNAKAIVNALDRLMDDLSSVRNLVGRADRPGLLDILEKASGSRRALPARWTRPEELAEVRVPVPDREGVLAEFTTLAGDLDINIYDIEIAHSAEGPRGVLVMVVDAKAAPAFHDAVVARGHGCTLRPLSS